MDSSVSRRNFFTTGIATAAWAFTPAFGETQDLTALSLRKASELLRSKAASPVDLTEACLKRIEKYNPSVSAFITVTGESALAAAREMEAEQRRGKWRSPLHGIPIALKANIDTAGVRTTGASELFKDRVPGEDEEVVRKLKSAGAIILGKLNTHEFAYGATSAVSYFGPVHNPWALDRISGGSSGGSIRIPSSHCGTVGLMPTCGRVSNRGVIPMAWTLDHVGPICKTVEDATLMLGAIAGFDELDPATVDGPGPDYTRAFKLQVAKLRLGLPRTNFSEGLDPEYAKAVNTAIEVLRQLTGRVMDMQLPAAVSTATIWDLNVDVLLTPAMKTLLGTITAALNGRNGGAADLNSVGTFDVYGLPAITVPCGFTSSGLPIGLQFSAAPFAEPTMLALAHVFEQATEWHTRRPTIKFV